MGGIGKTQCALAYVYSNKSLYQRIYWITAVDHASLLSGYQAISTRVDLPRLDGKTPTEIADAVLEWLRTQPSWLLVIDNLDDFKIAEGLLPGNGPGKHTLITTRNPRAAGISAEPFEIPLLDVEGSLELLVVLSNIPVQPENKKAAIAIVEEMEYLPLAIEQAAAYVREVTGEFSAYLEEYRKNRQDIHGWIPMEIEDYPYSVTTACSCPLNALRRNNPPAANLLRLFTFLNPDGIIIPFL